MARLTPQQLAAIQRQQREQERLQERLRKEAEKARREAEKQAKEAHLAEQARKVQSLNSDLGNRIAELEGILIRELPKKANPFTDAAMKEEFPPFQPSAELTTPIRPYTREQYLAAVPVPTGLAKLKPGWRQRHEAQLAGAEQQFEQAVRDCTMQEARRLEKLEKAEQEYEKQKEAYLRNARAHNSKLASEEQNYRDGDVEAILNYSLRIMEMSSYPDGFPKDPKVAYVPESRELVVDYQLPQTRVVPEILEHRYVKTNDEITSKPRTKAEVKERYQDIVASVALRTISELLNHDRGNHVDVIAYNGHVSTTDKATGKSIRPCLISVRVAKEAFLDIELNNVDKQICLRNLGAQVSQRPFEAVAVRPIIDFDMVDKRFVADDYLLSELESRPNLMDLNPFEFENLVTNLFSQMGLEAKLTRTSKDGGVDCVAFDNRPVVGGKVVVQAKRWKNTVGVNAVRDLYGTMMNEGANKGILVTTSGYGPDAFDFAKDKPIELINGSGLLYYLEQIGTPARIIMPEEG